MDLINHYSLRGWAFFALKKRQASDERDFSSSVFSLTFVACCLCFSQLFGIEIGHQSPASLGASGAYTSIADDSSGFFINPAGLARHPSHRLVFFEHTAIQSLKNWQIKGGFVDGVTEQPLHFGFLFSNYQTAPIKRDDYRFALAYNFQNFVLIGLSQNILKFRQALLTQSQWNYSADMGILIFPLEFLAIGASGENIYRTNSNALLLPRRARAGLSVNLRKFRIGGDIERNFSRRASELRFGAEYQAADFLQMRAGFYTDRKQSNYGYSTGIKLHYGENFALNASFIDAFDSDAWRSSTGIQIEF